MKEPYCSRIAAFREKMSAEGIDAYLILSDDFHASEYVDRYFQVRAWISGFTGSAGSVVVTKDEACLWTDGRYFLQAAAQLEGTGITLQRMGEPGVKTIPEWLADNLADNLCLGYDGRTVSYSMAQSLKKALRAKNIRFAETAALADGIWTDRPEFPHAPIWLLGEEFSGKSRAKKLEELRASLKQEGSDLHLIASLDDIAWLCNYRGSDIAHTPVAMAYMLISQDSAVLYIAQDAVSDDIRAAFTADGILLKPYLQVYEDLKQLPAGSSLLLDPSSTNVALFASIPADVKQVKGPCLTKLPKAIKNITEANNERIAHIRDGVAITKLIYRLKQHEKTEAFRRGELTELGIEAMLHELRTEQPDFLDESFGSIIASGPHGAIVHYSASSETDIPLQNNTFVLMDVGGHYLQGTTDTTRTVAIGTVTPEMKQHYTAVLRGHLDLAMACFKHGCTGANLDYLARSPLWELGLDFNHGTGHGVGYLLNVHEGPNGIRLKGRDGSVGAVLEEGMITSDEPGVYLEGKYGIRIENLVLCLESHRTSFGRFMKFDMLTMVPYDRSSILVDMLSPAELDYLNSYHASVFAALSPYLDEDETAWLKKETAPLTAKRA